MYHICLCHSKHQESSISNRGELKKLVHLWQPYIVSISLKQKGKKILTAGSLKGNIPHSNVYLFMSLVKKQRRREVQVFPIIPRTHTHTHTLTLISASIYQGKRGKIRRRKARAALWNHLLLMFNFGFLGEFVFLFAALSFQVIIGCGKEWEQGRERERGDIEIHKARWELDMIKGERLHPRALDVFACGSACIAPRFEKHHTEQQTENDFREQMHNGEMRRNARNAFAQLDAFQGNIIRKRDSTERGVKW